jgi:hypothetical protein
VGGYDPDFAHNEDAELDHRLRAAGYDIWLTGQHRDHLFPAPHASGAGAAVFQLRPGQGRQPHQAQDAPRLRQWAVISVGRCSGGVAGAAGRRARRAGAGLGRPRAGRGGGAGGGARLGLPDAVGAGGDADASVLVDGVLDPCPPSAARARPEVAHGNDRHLHLHLPPPSLGEAIASVRRQAIPKGVAIRVIVIDNDTRPTARDIVQAQADMAAAGAGFGSGVEINYLHAPGRNISLARNAALGVLRALPRVSRR